MESARQVLTELPGLLPLAGVVAALALGLVFANWLLLVRPRALGKDGRLPRQIAMLVLTVAAIIAAVLALPISDTTRGQLLGLLGLVLTGVIAFSSTTFVANAMAGLMLRSVKSFRPGDFIRIGDQFGRVTERGLFHTEIQTEDRDLTTLPNLYLVSHPVTVVRSSGTIISSTVSLGYDNPRQRIEALLVEAAETVGLQEPFVQILELGDFSVTYRAAGFLSDVRQQLTVRSNLRKSMFDTLHDAGIEIVSPAFMNQRPLPPQAKVLPPEPLPGTAPTEPPPAPAPEALIFDKAEAAERMERLRVERATLANAVKELETRLKTADESERGQIQDEIERTHNRMDAIARVLQTVKELTVDRG